MVVHLHALLPREHHLATLIIDFNGKQVVLADHLGEEPHDESELDELIPTCTTAFKALDSLNKLMGVELEQVAVVDGRSLRYPREKVLLQPENDFLTILVRLGATESDQEVREHQEVVFYRSLKHRLKDVQGMVDSFRRSSTEWILSGAEEVTGGFDVGPYLLEVCWRLDDKVGHVLSDTDAVGHLVALEEREGHVDPLLLKDLKLLSL